jgi:dihydroorotate dehydrogenase (NAD+) catalytic subunit
MRGYDWRKTYAWNYEHVPTPRATYSPAEIPGNWEFCGLPVASPLGVPAGPLLNSRWIHFYASLGFDVLTYKTVRSRARDCHPLPNLLPVKTGQLLQEPGACREAEPGVPFDSWAISFGMPSREPQDWRADVERARRGLRPDQVLVVSVVASPEPHWTGEEIADDYARCARWASLSGAQAIEANLSCPNVPSAEGDLYLHPNLAGLIARRTREVIPELPLIVKVGCFPNDELRGAFHEAVRSSVSAISTTNTVRATIQPWGVSGRLPFGGASRGIGGNAVSARCWEELVKWQEQVRTSGSSLRLIAVGGVSTGDDVRRRLAAGAHHVQLATAAMLDPQRALRIRAEWPKNSSPP